ncbi:rho GTPase-activating protein 25 [Eublepharis macularius]|uniref:Rho GTPase-activating protein 24 n=1 Tax=Eublepharis macularius TaxID=481883 RepID=A0AA97KCI9_EUBMA|nr:rho GTPase-activating protein 25 [Eublepharis macularius]
MSLKLPRNWDFNLKMDMSKIVRSQSMMAVDPKGPCTWPHTLNSLERPLKTGWLKKQRSIVKNWQQRFFVLKGQHLSYYKDEDDGKLQGVIRLHGSTIKEVAATSDEGGKFIFEVIPEISRDQNRTGQDSYLLMASSQSEMEDWVKSLRRVAGSPLGVVFGQQLVETMVYEQRFGQHQVPILVEKCTEFIRKHGLNEEGIFRLPGQDNLVKRLRDMFDAGERPSFDRETDVHTVASLFKLYLRELPEPVIPWAQYEDFLLCGQLLSADETKGRQQLMKQLPLLPQDNYNLLSYICRFLYEIQQNASTNKMSVENLATVFGVNLIRPKMEDPATIMRGTHHIQKAMTVMISEHTTLFPVSKDVPPSPPLQKGDSKKTPVPRSSVGWGAVERPLPSRKENRTQCQTNDDLEASAFKLDCSSDPSTEDNGDLKPKDLLGKCTTESRKRTQTLPNRKYFVNIPSNRAKQGEIFSGDFWSPSVVQPSPISSTGGHKRTLSEGLSKLFNLPQISNSDNSCSSLGATGTQTHNEHSLAVAADTSQKDLITGPGQNGDKVLNPSPGGESSPPEDLESLRKMIVELKREMEVQKKDYEEQINSLEKENYEVWAKVVRLNQEIEKEKSKFADLERKLQNIEHSRDDIEDKNKLLEQELLDSMKSRNQLGANK